MNTAIGLPECERVTGQFTEHYQDLGFQSHHPVDITSGIDPSVRLIGAPISVLKPYLGQNHLLENGIYLVQNCVRTHNLKTLFELGEPQEYGSFFTGLGALATTDQVELLFQETSKLLSNRLGIEHDEAFISVRSDDKDILSAAENNGFYDVKPDVMDPAYYRHEYGMAGVYGRNTSYWVKNRQSGEYEDIGNIIAIEGQEKSLGAEFAFGDTTLVKQLAGLSHVTDAYDLRLVDSGTPHNLRIRFEDSAITSMALLAEGLKPGTQNNQARILRTYLKGVSLFRRLTHVDRSTLADRLESYEEDKLPFNARGIGQYIVDWVVDYENRTAAEGHSSKEDIRINELLRSNIYDVVVDTRQ